MADPMLNTLRSCKADFWQEHSSLAEPEIQQRWDRRLKSLVKKLGAEPPIASTKRRVSPKTSGRDLRPLKRHSGGQPASGLSVPSGPRIRHESGSYPLQRHLSAPTHSVPTRRSSFHSNKPFPPSLGQFSPQSHSHPINIPNPPARPALDDENWHTNAMAVAPYSLPVEPVHQQSHQKPEFLLSQPRIRVDVKDLSPTEFVNQLTCSPQFSGGGIMPDLVQEDPTFGFGVDLHPTPSWPLSGTPASASSLTRTDSSLPGGISDGGSGLYSSGTGEPMSRSNTDEKLMTQLKMCHVNSQASWDLHSGSPAPTSGLQNFPDDVDCSGFFDLPSFDAVPSSLDMIPSLSNQNDLFGAAFELPGRPCPTQPPKPTGQPDRPLAPKTPAAKSTSAAPKLIEVVTEGGIKRTKAQICRTQMPAKESTKVFCPVCDEHKDGFHGQHELARHIDRAHKNVRKVYVCQDISPDRTFLAGCKNCRSQKAYGASYNAAAHLRRVHFNPCDTPRGGRGKDFPKRGGSGGGDQPPMEVVKRWMFEKWEVNTKNTMMNDQISPADVMLHAPADQVQGLDACDVSDPCAPSVTISDADLEFVAQTTRLDRSFYPQDGIGDGVGDVGGIENDDIFGASLDLSAFGLD